MDKWKTIAMMSMGFACGIVWTAACDVADSAKADDSGSWSSASSGGGAPPPTPTTLSARTFLRLDQSTDGQSCYYFSSEGLEKSDRRVELLGVDCCPVGFTFVGISENEQACLQNPS